MDAELVEPSTPVEEPVTARDLVPLDKPRLWPWVAFVLVTFLFNAAIYSIIWAVLFTSNIAAVLIPAVLYGEFCIALVVCGFWGRTWLEGYAAACLLSIMGCLFISIGEFADRWLYRSYFDISIQFSSICNMPVTILISSMGLMLFRALGSWRLGIRAGSSTSNALGINDLIIGTSLVALLVMLGRTIQNYSEQTTSEYWLSVAMPALFFAFTGLVVVVPTVWMVFRATHRRAVKLLATGVALSILSGGVTATIGRLTEASFEPISDFFSTAAGTLIAFTYVVIGLTTLRKTGLQLFTGKQPAATTLPRKESRLRRYGVPTALFTSIFALHLFLNAAIATR